MNTDFICIAAGSFNQGDDRFYPTEDRQCMANAVVALAWMTTGREFNSDIIDEILIKGK